MFKRVGFLACLLMVALVTVQASAAVVNYSDGGKALQAVLDGITLGPVPGKSSVDVTVDGVSDAYDSYWSITGSSATVTTFVVSITSEKGQVFGVYDALDPTNRAVIFTGKPGAGSQVTFAMDDQGNYTAYSPSGIISTGTFASKNRFGYYLTTSNFDTFFSDSSLNYDDGFDHMAAFAGGKGDTIKIGTNSPGEWQSTQYILAWEDGDSRIPGLALDFNDFVVLVESVKPVPEPAAMLVWGFLGIVGLCWLRRRKA